MENIIEINGQKGQRVFKICEAMPGVDKPIRGSYGSVYRVEELGTDNIYALKVLRLDVIRKCHKKRGLEKDKSYYEARFNYEIEILSKKIQDRSPYVIAYEDHGKIEKCPSLPDLEPGRLCLLTRWFKGETLTNIIHYGGYLFKDVIPIAKMILEGLRFLHEQSILFRDLKANNVMLILRHPVENSEVKLIDVGDTYCWENVPANFIVDDGCIPYRAPEWFGNIGDVSYPPPTPSTGNISSSDYYSFGWILWRMFTRYPMSNYINPRRRSIDERKRFYLDHDFRENFISECLVTTFKRCGCDDEEIYQPLNKLIIRLLECRPDKINNRPKHEKIVGDLVDIQDKIEASSVGSKHIPKWEDYKLPEDKGDTQDQCEPPTAESIAGEEITDSDFKLVVENIGIRKDTKLRIRELRIRNESMVDYPGGTITISVTGSGEPKDIPLQLDAIPAGQSITIDSIDTQIERRFFDKYRTVKVHIGESVYVRAVN